MVVFKMVVVVVVLKMVMVVFEMVVVLEMCWCFSKWWSVC